MTDEEKDPPHSVSQPLETRAVCPICFTAVPLDPQQSIYESCCGKHLCRGCAVASRRATLDKAMLKKKGRGKSKAELELLEFQLLIAKDNVPCAFCRTDRPRNDKELVERLQVRIDKYTDVSAMNQLGGYYIDGTHGLRQNRTEAMKLFLRSYELGSPDAANYLSYYHGGWLNRSKKLEYLKEGARRGHIDLSLELACEGLQNGTVDLDYAISLLVRAAKAGDDEAMGNCMKLYKSGHLSKQDLEATLRAKKAALDEVTNDDREFAKRFHAYCCANLNMRF